jgi:hypothetical protein
MLVRSYNSDKLSNRVVHVSVQLFSNEELALAMTEHHSLLHIMVSAVCSLSNIRHKRRLYERNRCRALVPRSVLTNCMYLISVNVSPIFIYIFNVPFCSVFCNCS